MTWTGPIDNLLATIVAEAEHVKKVMDENRKSWPERSFHKFRNPKWAEPVVIVSDEDSDRIYTRFSAFGVHGIWGDEGPRKRSQAGVVLQHQGNMRDRKAIKLWGNRDYMLCNIIPGEEKWECLRNVNDEFIDEDGTWI